MVESVRHGDDEHPLCIVILFILFNILLYSALQLCSGCLSLAGSAALIVIVMSVAFISIYNLDPQ